MQCKFRFLENAMTKGDLKVRRKPAPGNLPEEKSSINHIYRDSKMHLILRLMFLISQFFFYAEESLISEG